MCHHIQISTPFDKKKRKIEVAIAGDAKEVFDLAIHPLIRQNKGYRALMGTAPRTALERQVQEFIDQNKEEDEL